MVIGLTQDGNLGAPPSLAMMAQRYTLELVPGQRIEKQAAITLHQRDGMRMGLQPRR